jgi:TolC family type I secretion outer membrane protein
MTFKPTPLAGMLLALSVSLPLQAMPLADELAHVLENHPMLRATRHAVDASQQRIDAARSGYRPRVTVTGDGGLESIRSTSYKPSADMKLGNDGLVTPATASDLARQKLGVSVEQSLYDGGRTRSAVELAQVDLSIQDLNLGTLTQDVLLEALTAYLQVGRYQTLIGLTRLNEETTLSQLDLESKRVAGGGGIAVDVLQARTRLQIVKERRVFYQQALRDAMANYEQTFGHAPDPLRLQDLDIPTASLPADLSTALTQGVEASPKLKVAALQVARAGQSVAAVRASGLPAVDLVGAANRDRNAGATARRDDYSLLLRLSWTFATGFENQYRTAAALKDRLEQEERETGARSKVKESIRVSWNQVVNGKERLDLLDNAAGIARDVMLSRKRLRDAGKETALGALDAEVEYFGVLANKINAMYDTRLGAYRLLSATGRLSPEDVGIGGTLKLPVKPLRIDLGSIAGDGMRP